MSASLKKGLALTPFVFLYRFKKRSRFEFARWLPRKCKRLLAAVVAATENSPSFFAKI